MSGTEGTRRQVDKVRRYIWWSLCTTPVVVLFPTGVTLFVHVGPLRLVLGLLSLVLFTAEYLRLLYAVMQPERALRIPAWEPALVGALLLTEYADMAPRPPVGEYWAVLPAGLAGVVLLWLPAERRRGFWLYSTVLVAAVGVSATSLHGDGARSSTTVLIGALIAVPFMVFVHASTAYLWDAVQELDRHRKVAAELAVAEERLRFAADLHDIQGHNLQAIALKGELAERLVGWDDEAVRTQTWEIAELARTALSETRALVQNYRRTDLGTEITNAVGILGAAGIDVTVHGAARDVPLAAQPLFGALVREGTTNLLRHSRARTATLRMATSGGRVTAILSNDGISGRLSMVDGSGIAGLRKRFAAAGGTVDAAAVNGRFELTASIPEGAA